MSTAPRTKKMALLSLCCIVCLAALVQGSAQAIGNGNGKGKGNGHAVGIGSGTPKSTFPSTFTKDATHTYKLRRQDKYQRRQGTAASSMPTGSALMLPGAGQMPSPKRQRNLTKSAHGLNKKLLNKMGFIKVKAPNSHNRKRLAVESRRIATRDDSHMFIIKLPPNLHYYTAPNSPKNAVAAAQPQTVGSENAQKPATAATTATATSTTTTTKAASAAAMSPAEAVAAAALASAASSSDALKTNGKKVSFPFSSNGRPGRIYHWNLPVLKQALNKKPHFAHVSSADRNRLLDIKDIPTWRKPWENETIEKSFSAGGAKSKYKKSLKPKSPTYYAPSQAVNKHSFNKYFAGNGKPKGFYVIKEHQAKPLFYQNIIS